MTRKTTASERTRQALILAGEQLFGEHGIDGVSLRQINTAAGQKNSSAAHYHFGSKDALVKAIYDYRMERVNRRRLEMLEELKETGREHEVRALVEAVVYPIAEEIHDSEGGSHYIRFLAQMMGHPQVSPASLRGSRFAEGLSRVVTLLQECLPEVPEPLLGQRFGLMWEQTIHALADRERIGTGPAAPRGAAPALFVSNLVDTVAGGLSAEVSAVTRAELGIQKKATNSNN